MPLFIASSAISRYLKSNSFILIDSQRWLSNSWRKKEEGRGGGMNVDKLDLNNGFIPE